MPFRIVAALARHRVLTLIAAVVVMALLAPGLADLRIDNQPQRFFPDDARGLEHYQALRALFGPGETVHLLACGPAVWSHEGLAWLSETEDRLARVTGVVDAAGLERRHRTGLTAWPPVDPEALHREAMDDPLDAELGWVTRDGACAGIVVIVTPRSDPQRVGVLERLRAATATPPAGISLTVGGLPLVDQALDTATRGIPGRSFPLLVAFAVGVLALAFRRASEVAAILGFVTLCMVGVFGALGLTGVPLDLVVVVTIPLVFAVAVATGVHLLVGLHAAWEEDHGDAVEEIVAAYRERGWATFWAGVTTAAGFASLAVSDLAPVRALALTAGCGIAAVTAAAFLVLPAILASVSPLTAEDHPRLEVLGGGGRWAEAAVRRRHTVLLGTLVLAAGAVGGLPRLRLESNALRYLSPRNPARQGVETLEARGVGVAAVEVLLRRPPDEEEDDSLGTLGFQGVAGLQRLAALADQWRGRPLVLGVAGGGEVLAVAVRRALPPGSEPSPMALSFALQGLRRDDSGRRLLEAFVSPEGDAARVVVSVPMVSEEVLAPLLAELAASARGAFPGVDVAVSGAFPLLLEAQRTFVATLALSLLLTTTCVTAVLWLLLGRLKLAALALVPNLGPVLLVLGGMGWLGVPLDSATVAVASVILGLAVDDTLHTLGPYRRLHARIGRHAAVVDTLARTAPAYLVTGAVLGAGFASCALSGFAPTARFGTLAAVGIALAVAADLWLLPALLAGRRPRAGGS